MASTVEFRVRRIVLAHDSFARHRTALRAAACLAERCPDRAGCPILLVG